jgi:hypothetical protein
LHKKNLKKPLKAAGKLPQISCMKIRKEFLDFYLGGRINEKLSMRVGEQKHTKLLLLILQGSLALLVSESI